MNLLMLDGASPPRVTFRRREAINLLDGDRVETERLGYRAGLHRNYVGAIERGEINPTFRVLLKLERGLQIPLSEIVALAETRRAERTKGSEAAQ